MARGIVKALKLFDWPMNSNFPEMELEVLSMFPGFGGLNGRCPGYGHAFQVDPKIVSPSGLDE